MKTLRVKTNQKSYDVIIGEGALQSARELIKERGLSCRSEIITDDNVAKLYFEKLRKSLDNSGIKSLSYVLGAGESAKSAENLILILNFLAENGFDKNDFVVSLGGGVAGDIAGLAASLYMRGVSLVHIPTTLLAAVDSSIGGKTAINLKGGKNLAGTFCQPDLVITDPLTLSTLRAEEVANGYAEIIKYAMIKDGNILNLSSQSEIIYRCAEIKRDIVARDERDGGIRRLLNFGHTFGHAAEKLSSYTLPHGRAVAAGMKIVTAASVKKGICGGECLEFLLAATKKHSLDFALPYGEDEMFFACLADKKKQGDFISLVVPKKVGKAEIIKISLDEVRDFLEKGIS